MSATPEIKSKESKQTRSLQPFLLSPFHVHIKQQALWLAFRCTEKDNNGLYKFRLTGGLESTPGGGLIAHFNILDFSTEEVFLSLGDELSAQCQMRRLALFNTADNSSLNRHDQSKLLDSACRSGRAVNLNRLLACTLHVAYRAGTGCSTVFEVNADVMTPDNVIKATPTRERAVMSTSVSIDLLHTGHLPSSGYLLNAGEKLMMVLETDVKIESDQTLQGIWVQGVSSITDPYVWAACLRYLHCSLIKNRVRSGFILLLQPSAGRVAEFYRCSAETGQLTFDVYKAQTQVTLTGESMSADIELEMKATPEYGDKSAQRQDGANCKPPEEVRTSFDDTTPRSSLPRPSSPMFDDVTPRSSLPRPSSPVFDDITPRCSLPFPSSPLQCRLTPSVPEASFLNLTLKEDMHVDSMVTSRTTGKSSSHPNQPITRSRNTRTHISDRLNANTQVPTGTAHISKGSSHIPDRPTNNGNTHVSGRPSSSGNTHVSRESPYNYAGIELPKTTGNSQVSNIIESSPFTATYRKEMEMKEREGILQIPEMRAKGVDFRYAQHNLITSPDISIGECNFQQASAQSTPCDFIQSPTTRVKRVGEMTQNTRSIYTGGHSDKKYHAEKIAGYQNSVNKQTEGITQSPGAGELVQSPCASASVQSPSSCNRCNYAVISPCSRCSPATSQTCSRCIKNSNPTVGLHSPALEPTHNAGIQELLGCKNTARNFNNCGNNSCKYENCCKERKSPMSATNGTPLAAKLDTQSCPAKSATPVRSMGTNTSFVFPPVELKKDPRSPPGLEGSHLSSAPRGRSQSVSSPTWNANQNTQGHVMSQDQNQNISRDMVATTSGPFQRNEQLYYQKKVAVQFEQHISEHNNKTTFFLKNKNTDGNKTRNQESSNRPDSPLLYWNGPRNRNGPGIRIVEHGEMRAESPMSTDLSQPRTDALMSTLSFETDSLNDSMGIRIEQFGSARFSAEEEQMSDYSMYSLDKFLNQNSNLPVMGAGGDRSAEQGAQQEKLLLELQEKMVGIFLDSDDDESSNSSRHSGACDSITRRENKSDPPRSNSASPLQSFAIPRLQYQSLHLGDLEDVMKKRRRDSRPDRRRSDSSAHYYRQPVEAGELTFDSNQYLQRHGLAK